MDTFYLDTETTGLLSKFSFADDEIVEIAIVDSDGRPVLNTLVKPTIKTSWRDAQRIHGISPSDVAGAPTLEDLLREIRSIVRNNQIVIYNAGFDTQFFPQDVFAESTISCAMLAYAEYKGEWNAHHGNYKWHKLSVAAAATGFKEDVTFHRALGDALAARHVWLHVQKEMAIVA